MNNPAVSFPPIVTFTTDFGVSDYYAAAMKAAVLRQCPPAVLIDVTHQVPPQDVLAGAITLERAVASFPQGTVHLTVVDPGVGTARRLLIAEVDGATVVCPDNGLITWAYRRCRGRVVFHELLWRPARGSHTFHGRDIMAPVAGMLAAGEKIDALARRVADPCLLDIAPATDPAQGQIIHIDHFGNATTNIPADRLPAAPATIRVAGRQIQPLVTTYQDVPPGVPLALIGSSDLLEIAVRDGSAAATLSLKIGDPVSCQ